MSVLKVKNGNQWDIVPAIKGDPGDPAADESITDDMLVTDGIKTEIEWLWGNQLMDSREGELLHAEDAYTAPAVDISVDGKSTQVTTTGKNLLNPTTKTLVLEEPMPAGTTLTASCAGNTGQVRYYDVDDRQIDYWTTKAVSGSSRYAVSFTLLQDTYSFKWVDITSACKERQLELGSSATAYEPYTGGKPSPNPDYPQEIVSVESAKLNFAGKNLINVVNTSGVAVDGNMITVTGNNRDLFTGTTGRSVAVEDLSKLPLLPAGTFAFSCNKTGSSNLFLDFADSEGLVHNIRTSAAADTRMAWKFTLDEPTRITVRATSTTITDLQIEMGDVATEYAPFDSLISVLFNSNAPLRSLPDGTKDELHLSYLRPSTREGWAWYSRELVQKLHEITLNACTWLFYSATAFYTRGLNLPFTAGNVEVLCNIFKPSASKNLGGLANAEINSIQVLGRNELGIKTASEYQDVSAFVASLDDSDVAVAKLATPITTQLDPIELPIMPSKDTTIWSDPSAQLKMTYIQDTNLVIESLEATVADMATS